MAGFH